MPTSRMQPVWHYQEAPQANKQIDKHTHTKTIESQLVEKAKLANKQVDKHTQMKKNQRKSAGSEG